MVGDNHTIALRWRRNVAAWDWLAVTIVLVGVGLRWWLVMAGGQYWFPDEKRFVWSGFAVGCVEQGQWRHALEPLLVRNTHPGFTLLGCVPVAAEWVWARWHGLPWTEATFLGYTRISACCFSLASIACIYLVRVVVLAAGGGRREAVLAMGLLASANTMFYYSRHLLPYDASMALALASLAVGLKGEGRGRLVVSGSLAWAAFITYYGYWALVGVVSAVVIMWNAKTADQCTSRLRWFVLGFGMWLAAFVLGTTALFEQTFCSGMSRFAATVTQGAFSEGWSLPWEYLWRAEHGFLVLCLLGLAASVWMVATKRETARYGLIWGAMAAAVYLLLVGGSVCLHKFVVYGRSARQMVPFFCLSAAFAGARMEKIVSPRAMKYLWAAGALFLTVQAAYNFHFPLKQWFPDQVRHLAARYGEVSEALTVEGPSVVSGNAKPSASGRAPRYVLVNVQYLYPVLGERSGPHGATLHRFAHPQQFYPYQYEGFTPDERRLLRTVDISMRLLDTAVEP